MDPGPNKNCVVLLYSVEERLDPPWRTLAVRVQERQNLALTNQIYSSVLPLGKPQKVLH